MSRFQPQSSKHWDVNIVLWRLYYIGDLLTELNVPIMVCAFADTVFLEKGSV
jgi:hypothetical protein